MQKAKVTLQSIANSLNVSKVTVHKALTNKPGVGPELKKQIIQTAEKMGYSAKNPKTSDTLHFLYLFPKRFFFSAEPFYTVIYYDLQNLIKKNHYTLQLLVINDDEYEKKLPPVLQDSQFAGIFIGGEIERRNIMLLEKQNIPLVFIDFFSHKYPGSYIYADNYHGSYYLTKYLIEMGHHRISFVGDPNHADSIADRYYGYLKALTRNKITPEPELFISQHIDNITDLSQIQLPQNLPTAFLCSSNHSAFRLYLKLQTMNLKIPDDVSVVAFDNTDLCETISPKLTSCGCQQSDFALYAFQLMKNMLEKSDKAFIHHSMFPIIFKRDSVRNISN